MTHPARRLWQAVETLHAVTCFAPQCRDGASAAGLRGFWMGYFAGRAAPLGPVGPAPVVAAFAGFRPSTMSHVRGGGLAIVLLAVVAGCGGTDAATTAPSTTSTATVAPATTTTTAPTTTTSAWPALPGRVVDDQAWTPMVSVGDVTLVHPSARVEHVGFHESNNDGALQLEPLPTAVDPVILETRDRGTGSRTAADVVVDPAVEIRAPVTGTVLRAGGYTLYCDYRDDYVVIEPDAHTGWEVKVLHISGVQVTSGDRVTAGVTVIAPGPHVLPFPSQVDVLATAKPPWPHVHIEVVDPSIPDRPGAGC